MKTFTHEIDILHLGYLDVNDLPHDRIIENKQGVRGILTGRYDCNNRETCSDCKVHRRPYSVILKSGCTTGWCWSLWRTCPI